MSNSGGRESFEHHHRFIGPGEFDIIFQIVEHYGIPCKYRLPSGLLFYSVLLSTLFAPDYTL